MRSTSLKTKIDKIFNLLQNYRNSIDSLLKRLPAFGDVFKTSPQTYFIAAEIIEEIFNIDEQLFTKFENIIDLCFDEIKQNENSANKGTSLLLADAIEEFKNCNALSESIKERAYINVNQISTPDFTCREDTFTEEQKSQIRFAEKTMETYSKKVKNNEKSYDLCIAKAAKLFGIIDGLFNQ